MSLSATQAAPEHPVAALIRRQGVIAAEIATATGCDAETASCAAGSYLTFPTDPRHGFGDIWSEKAEVRALHARAEAALKGWLAAAPVLQAAE